LTNFYFFVKYRCLGAWRNWQTCLPAGRRAKNALMYFVYAISSKNKNYIYVGMTDNLKRRFYQHNSGKEKTTKPYLPFELLFTQEFTKGSIKYFT